MQLAPMSAMRGAILLSGLLSACGGSGGGPAAPSAIASAGCQGERINNVYFALSSGGRFTAQLFGEEFTHPPRVEVIRSVVPCDYELTGRILDVGPLLVTIGFANNRREPDRGGVIASSIAVVDGPNPRIFRPGEDPVNPGKRSCFVELNPRTFEAVPASFTIRFRIDATVRDGARCERS